MEDRTLCLIEDVFITFYLYVSATICMLYDILVKQHPAGPWHTRQYEANGGYGLAEMT
jgi:hypothetical protein